MRGLVYMRGERWIFRAKLSSGCTLSTPAYKRQERQDGVRFPSSLVTKSKLKYEMVHRGPYLNRHGVRYEQKRRGKEHFKKNLHRSVNYLVSLSKRILKTLLSSEKRGVFLVR